MHTRGLHFKVIDSSEKKEALDEKEDYKWAALGQVANLDYFEL